MSLLFNDEKSITILVSDLVNLNMDSKKVQIDTATVDSLLKREPHLKELEVNLENAIAY